MGTAVTNRLNGLKGGRPKGSKTAVPALVKELILERYRAKAAELADEMIRIGLKGKFEPTRVQAIDKIQDRIFGKPPQPHDGNGLGGSIVLQVFTGVPEPDSDEN
jgi:hypothetical protein